MDTCSNPNHFGVFNRKGIIRCSACDAWIRPARLSGPGITPVYVPAKEYPEEVEGRAEEEIQKEIQKTEPVMGICLRCSESRSLVGGVCEDCW